MVRIRTMLEQNCPHCENPCRLQQMEQSVQNARSLRKVADAARLAGLVVAEHWVDRKKRVAVYCDRGVAFPAQQRELGSVEFYRLQKTK